MDNMSLYQIDKNIKEVLENGFSFNEETGEILFETEDLEKLEISLNDKLNNIIGYIKDLEIQAESYEKIKKDYENRSKEKSKKADRLKKYLDEYLKANGMTDKREFANGVTSYRKSKQLNITSDVDLENYLLGSEEHSKYLKTEYKVDKTGLKKEIENGTTIPFAEVVEKQNLQIK